jgi:hypothetical protein
MVTDRFLEPRDLALLELSLSRDEHHKGTTVDFFTQYGTVCKTYSDEQGPILFARASKALRIDLHYVDNADTKRNMKAMLGGFDELAKRAKENGFLEIVITSNVEMLRKFCIRRFGFVEERGELRKFI